MTASHLPYPEEEEDDENGISTIPFVNQPAYGSKLWKRPIPFVREGTHASPTTTPTTVLDGPTIASKYLSIVLKDRAPAPKPTAHPTCPICSHPVKEPTPAAHHLSPFHQAALPEMHTPSGIDRSRFGLKMLQKHGFDVDARRGLGAHGQGMLFPIVPREKRDRLGLGGDREAVEGERGKGVGLVGIKGTMDAGRVRRAAGRERRRDEELRGMFYGDDRVERYLGGGPVDHGLK